MLVIRLFSPTDVPAVMEIVKRSLGESYPPSLYLTIHNLWAQGFLLALQDGIPCGFLAAVPTGSKVARILMIAVLPDMRKQSFGQRLMEQFYVSCKEKGFDTIILEVRKSNKEAISFYELQGFSFYGEISGFYTNGEDAFKMMKVLQT